jgi:hypothetical protein
LIETKGYLNIIHLKEFRLNSIKKNTHFFKKQTIKLLKSASQL